MNRDSAPGLLERMESKQLAFYPSVVEPPFFVCSASIGSLKAGIG